MITVRLELQDALTSREEVPSDSRRSPSGATVAAGALQVGIAAGAAIVSRVTEREPEHPIHFSMEVPEIHVGRRQVTLSPDGQSLAFGARSGEVFHRSLGALDEEAPSSIAEGRAPFFSPDGRWIGFRDGNTLKKVASSGGEPVSICECAGDYVWSEDDLILFTVPEGLMRVSANGGEPERVFPDDDGVQLQDPQLLPGGNTLLATEVFDGTAWIISLSLTTRERTRLVQGHSAQYLEPGYVIFARGSLQTTSLFASRFDADELELRGDIISIADDVITRGRGRVAQFSVSKTGTLVYARRPVRDAENRIVWIDRGGLATALIDDEAAYRDPRLSPDGSLLAYTIVPGDGLWVYDLARGSRTLVQEGVTLYPVWTPNGEALTFSLQTVSDGFSSYTNAADGSGEARQLVKDTATAPAWSPDGRVLFYQTSGDIWALSDEGKAAPLITAEAALTSPRVSPNGRWICYVSDVSGQNEVYVVPLPAADRRFRVEVNTISTDGGHSPVWSRDGRELFYIEGDRLMAVAVETADEFQAKTPQELFRGNLVPSTGISYDVSPDGKRFVAVQGTNTTESLRTVLHFVIHFDDQIRQRLP